MEQTVRISDLYMPMLARLSDDDKLDIISKLVETMRSNSSVRPRKPDLRTCFSREIIGRHTKTARQTERNGST